MTKLFEHTTIPKNSSTSPVESLATEVSVGFEKIEKILLDTKVPSPNILKLIGEFFLADMKKHGKIQEYTDAITIQKNQSSIVLSAIPTQVSNVSYLDSLTSTTVYLEEKNKTQPFTTDHQYKVLGKNLYLSGDFSNKTLQVQYRGLVPSLGSLTGYTNVIFNKDNQTYLITPTEVEQGVKFEIEYDIDLQAKSNEIFKSGQPDENTFLYGLTVDNDFIFIPYQTLTLNQNKITVQTDFDINEILSVFVYNLNITISELLTNLYIDYVNHDHNSLGVSKSIKHVELVDTFVNTVNIFYKDVKIPNYDHPQYLNREGYNPALAEIYNNALLGDLFLSALINGNDQEYKSLSKNSNAIIFGDPIAGSKVYYDALSRMVTLSSGATLNGFNINIGTGKTGLSLNNTTKIGEDLHSTFVIGREGNVVIKGDGTNEGTLTSENINVTKTLEAKSVKTEEINFGEYKISISGDNIVAKGKEDSVFEIENLTSSKIETGILKVEDLKLDKGNKISVTDNILITNEDDTLAIKSDKTIKFYVPTMEAGVKFGSKDVGSFKFHYSNREGSTSATNNHLYIEAPEGSKIKHLRSTEDVVTFNNKTYAFNKDGSDVKVTSLDQWFRSDIEVGNVDADSIVVKATNGSSKNGIVLGTSHLYTLGSNTNCPQGLTVLESAATINFITPRTNNDVGCDGFQYQALNAGSLQVFGDFGAEGDAIVHGNITTSSDISGKNLTLSESLIASTGKFEGSLTTNSLKVQENLEVSAQISAGNLNVSGDIKGNTLSLNSSLEVGQNSNFNRNVSVGADLSVKGRISSESGFATAGRLEAESLATGDITGRSLVLSDGAKISGVTSFTGPMSLVGGLTLSGSEKINGSLEVTQDITTKTLYVMDVTNFDGRIISIGDSSFTGKTIALGQEGSTITLTGKVDFNTTNTSFSGNMSVLGELEVFKLTTLNNGLEVKGLTNTTSLKVESTATIQGALKADSGDFTRKVTLNDGLKASGISEIEKANINTLTSVNASTDDLYVKNVLNMGANSVIKTSRLETSAIIQNDPAETSSFVGPLKATNEVSIRNDLVIGNENIKNTRNTSGIHITDNTIKMGNNSTITAVKIFAGKGVPRDGNEDLTGGFCFQSPTSLGTHDGDTGMFATLGSGSGVENSDLQFYIDGSKKGEFTSSPFVLPAYSNNVVEDPVKAKYLITYDLLLQFKQQIKEEITKTLAASVLASYPIGTVYTNSRDSRNPSHKDLLGTGVWIPYAPGRVIIGLVSSAVGGTVTGGLTPPANMKATVIGSESGEYLHTMTIEELVRHSHKLAETAGSSGGGGAIDANYDRPGYSNDYAVEATGGGQPFNIVQPSIIAATWERIA